MSENDCPEQHNEQTKDEQETSDRFNELIKQGFGALMPTIRASNSLPKEQQWDLFCTSPAFKPIMESLGNKALDLMSLILHHQGMYRDITKRDLEEKYELIVEANDKILERVGIHLDELSGIRRNPIKSAADIPVSPIIAVSGSWNRDVAKSAAWKEVKLGQNAQTPVVLRNARITQRPQVKFIDKIDNSSTPFEPRIKDKPNALKPLAILYESLPNEDPCYSHPYEFELERFQDKIETLDLKPKEPQYPKPVEETTLLMITQENQLMDMLQDLRSQSEIAVDLEHHSYRSFQGFTCLMQISTREKDYIIDTLELRNKLHVLNEVFTDPKIVKVFHGADSDVQWLQRDLCLYVVNMFDTYQASLMLSLPRLSLAFLLKTYCNVEANKHFQLYDWRNRPLAKDAIKYAREDTHYLLYIFDMLWNKLIEKSNGGTQLLQSVLFRSTDTCKKRYWKSIFKEDSYDGMYRQSRKNYDNRQMYALKELYAWRDKTAREEDESVGYILPNHMLLLIAEKLPKEMQGILACCNPIPPLVRQNLVLLHQIILKAREQPLVARVVPALNSENRIRPAPQTNINLEGALHCPHDLTHSADFRDDLPTLLSNTHVDVNCNIDLLQSKPVQSVFSDPDSEVEDSNVAKMNLPNQIHFMSPFERYKKMLLYVEEEGNKTEEEREQQIARDTQNLLDECMREIQKNAAANTMSPSQMINVKEENQDDNLRPKKRVRSQDSTNCDSPEDALNDVSVKAETSFEEPNKSKKLKYSARYVSLLSKSTPEDFPGANNPTTSSKEPTIEDGCPIKKRKRNKMSVDKIDTPAVMQMDVGTKKKTTNYKAINNTPKSDKISSENFSQYDYSQVDYNQYQQSASSLTPKNSHNKFKHKGKKNQQNKSFTFARQFGSGSSHKKKF